MSMDEQGTGKKRRRGIYLLPNLFTTGTLFGGFYAIISAMDGNFSAAAAGILAAMIADGLDGRIARLTNTSSDFGKEYDSLCDMGAFGFAASIVIYAFSLHYFAQVHWLGGKLGWAVAFLYAACAALRLARFNVLATRGGASGDFFGLPSPAAAGLVGGYVWAANESGLPGDNWVVMLLAAVVTAGAGILMVSNFRFAAFKNVKIEGRVPFRYIVVMVCLLALFAMDPPHIFFLTFFGYALTGPVMSLVRRYKNRKAPPATPA